MPKQIARTGADFASKHVRKTAVVRRINEILAQIRAVGAEHWEYEADLSKPPYSISANDLAAFRDQFSKYWVRTEVQQREKPYTVWFGDSKVAARYRAAAPKVAA